MGKSKPADASKGKSSKRSASPVKNGGIIKSSHTKAHKKDMVKGVTSKVEKMMKDKKKSKKAPSPEPSSNSESEDEDSEASSDEDSEEETKKPKANGKTNGASKAKAVDPDTSDSSASSDNDSEDDESDAPAAKAINGAKKAKAESDSESETSSSGNSESEADVKKHNVKTPNGKADAKSAPKKETKESDDEEESDDASDDSSNSDSSESESEAEPAPKKRKASEPLQAEAKKQRPDPNAADPSCNLFVGNISWNVDEEWLSREFSVHGDISLCRIITDRESGRPKGFGYVEFQDIDTATKAAEAMNGQELDGRELKVNFATPRPPRENGRDRGNSRAQAFGDSLSTKSSTLFVGNISFEANEDIVSQEFGAFATVKTVRLPTDRESGEMKGYGYVEFYSEEDAEKAITEGAGMNICGRAVRLDYSTPRPSDGGRGGFRGGRGGDRGGRGGGRGGFRGGFDGGRGRGRGGAPRGGRGGTTNRGGFGDFQGAKKTFD